MAIPIRSGRDVSESDTVDTPYVAVASESFAHRYWRDENPIGRHFNFGLHDREIVGVVGDVRVRRLERASEPQAYLPYSQVPDGWLIGYSRRTWRSTLRSHEHNLPRKYGELSPA